MITVSSLRGTSNSRTSRHQRFLNEAIRQSDLINQQAHQNNQVRSDIDIVDELVEQALVDNLLDGNIYSSPHGIRPSIFDSGESNSDVVSGNGDVTSSMNSSTTMNTSTDADNDSDDPRSQAVDESSLVDTESNGFSSSAQDFIDIFVRFVNEREIKLRVKPDDTIMLLKR